MAKSFFLAGEEPSTAIEVDISSATDFDALQLVIAGNFAIADQTGIAFQANGDQLLDLDAVKAADVPVGITIDGHPVRDVPGADGLPFFGNYFETFPDHLGNHQRMFDRYGPIFQENNMGRTSYQINDPKLTDIVFAESDFFSKEINTNHPLYPIKDQQAGVFLADTSDPSWKIVHKFMPPALGPKAVRHYAPTMNATIDSAIPVFDKLEESGEAWNAYQYMLKLGSEAIGKLIMGMEFHQFDSVDAEMHEMVKAIALSLSLNKKIATHGDWYANLPFGDPKKLRELKEYQRKEIEKSIANAASSGSEDLELQEAALKSANVIDYLNRATDSQGNKLPKENLVSAVIVAAGAGFVTTSTLLSWLLYGLVSYPGMQERLLQELVDNDFSDDTEVTPELIEKLTFQESYIKEMQRLHNPSYQPGRTAQVDMILPGGYKIKKGSVIIGAIHHIHNNPQYWENPAKFDPDRWSTDKVKNLPKSAYIPFATGPRMCIGFNFALQEIKIFLPKLVWRYQWFKEGDAAVEYDPFFQLIRPVNLYVRTTKRTSRPSKSDSFQS